MESNIYLYLTHTIELLDRFEAYLDTNCANPDVFKKEIKENNEVNWEIDVRNTWTKVFF